MRFFPFGLYAGPIAEFPSLYQESYADLFRRAQPIDFGIGYRWRTHETNLLLAVKLPDDGTGTADAVATDAPPPKPARTRVPRPPESIGPQRGGFFWFYR